MCSPLSEDHSADKRQLLCRIFYAARDDMDKLLYSLTEGFSNHEERNKVFNEMFVEEDGQQCTPLIAAARKGNENTVNMILSHFQPDLEIEGTVKIDGFVIEGATALWCACAGGHLDTIKLLVRYGANVNHATRTNSTPVRAACFDGRLDIVKYLTKHGANIHIANKYNNTCLMIASYKGHFDVITYLLENNANSNEKALCGATALHFAAESGNLSIVQELVKHNAELTCENDVGMTPLKAAAERSRESVVNYLVELPAYSLEDKIDAYELLGASYANDRDYYSVELAYRYLHVAMKLRYQDSDHIVIRKKLIKPVPAYDNWVESQTLDELEHIQNNPNAIHMESLTIRERILGAKNHDLPHPIIYRGAVFADNARFDRCISLWLHAIELRQNNNVSVAKDFLRFAQVFSQMFHLNVGLDIASVIAVLKSVTIELEKNREKMRNPGPKDDPFTILEETENNIMTTLYLLAILTKLIKLEANKMYEFEINKLVFKINRMKLRCRDGQTLLHLALNSETPVDDFHINDVCRFPCADTATLLINSGADVNAMDADRNTPLHVIVNYPRSISDFSTLHTTIKKLINAGAHIDCVNSQGKTPMDSAANKGVAEIILQTHASLSLKCLAATAVQKNNIPYVGTVPKLLEDFVDMHGLNIS